MLDFSSWLIRRSLPSLLGGCLCLWMLSFPMACSPAHCDACLEGQQRCDEVNNAGWICTPDPSNGCLLWKVIPCENKTVCILDNGKVTCAQKTPCDGSCRVGEKRCQENQVQTCLAKQQGSCPDWGPSQTCPVGQSCTDGICGAEPPPCQNVCQEGSKQCAGNRVQMCSKDTKGCLIWTSVETCTGNQTCTAGRCREGTCTSSCTQGAKRCQGNAVQACNPDASGCLDWGAPVSCPSGQTCQAGVCKTGCQPACTAGAKRCQANAIQTCTQTSGCLGWGQAAPCPSGQTCQKGACKPTCRNLCQNGTKRCQGTSVQTCTKGADGCLTWSPAKACKNGQVCQGGACQTTCPSTCSSGQKRCQGTSVQTCTKDAKGCLVWGQSTACPSGQTCNAGKCVTPGDPSQRSQQTICARWKKDFPAPSPHGFKNSGGCDPGNISQASINEAIRRINLYRWLIGLVPTAEDTSLSKKTQSCAILQANNDSWGGGSNPHHPPSNWKCYTKEGGATSGASNLSWGVSKPADTITQYISDHRVASLGHRLWIISPNFTRTGIGMATGSNRYRVASCLYTFARGSAPPVDFVAYPPPGFVPIQAMGSRRYPVNDWSFTSRKYNITQLSEVTMIRASDNNIQKLKPRQIRGYGHPSGLAWRPRTPQSGETYTVKLGSIYSYTVKFFDCR